jgi:type I restriction enzyme, S subunit
MTVINLNGMKSQEIALDNIATIIMGTSPKGETYNNDGVGMPLLNGPTEFGSSYPECTLYTTDSKRECIKGDLIFCVRGSTTGRMNWADKSYSLGRGVCAIRGKTLLDTKFIKYCLDLKLNGLLKLAGGGTFPNLTKDDICQFPFPYPKSRYKIASILSAYDDLIENNTRRIKILEEMAQMLYREWFVNFRFPNHENVKMIESELGLIPEGWEVLELDKVVQEIIDYRGKTPKKLGGDWAESGIIAISALNVKQGRLISLEKSKLVSEELYKKWMKSELSRGDILMTSEAPLGELYYLVTHKKFCLSQRIFGIRANPNLIKPVLLYMALNSPLIQGQILARASGSTVSGIRQSALRQVPIIIPPQNLQIDIETKLENMLLAIENLQSKNINLRKTRDLLLPKLISGEIDVENLDIETVAAAA